MMQTKTDFSERRVHLAKFSDEELRLHFWELAARVTEPLIELSRTHTSPSVERSVLLRMGFSSLEAKEIVSRCMDMNLMGKGVGHAVWRLSVLEKIDIREAGCRLAKGEGWQRLLDYWMKGQES